MAKKKISVTSDTDISEFIPAAAGNVHFWAKIIFKSGETHTISLLASSTTAFTQFRISYLNYLANGGSYFLAQPFFAAGDIVIDWREVSMVHTWIEK
ncbi:MAG: hypothetical protein Q7V02_05270 [Methylophilus sp.]|nr:hypothetical protein [Methylophilus sp.]